MILSQAEYHLDIIKQALRYWDPIGVIDHNDKTSITNNEYDCYAAELLVTLNSGIDSNGIANRLAQLRHRMMSLGELHATEYEIKLAKILTSWRDSQYKNKPVFI
jgi:hypothetical protein